VAVAIDDLGALGRRLDRAQLLPVGLGRQLLVADDCR